MDDRQVLLSHTGQGRVKDHHHPKLPPLILPLSSLNPNETLPLLPVLPTHHPADSPTTRPSHRPAPTARLDLEPALLRPPVPPSAVSLLHRAAQTTMALSI